MTRRAIALLAAMVAMASGAAMILLPRAATSAEPRGRHEILMKAVSFAPRSLTVQLGDTVVWRNADIVRHSADAGERLSSGDLRSGESYTWVPSDSGRIRYRCTIHQRMRGEIHVRR